MRVSRRIIVSLGLIASLAFGAIIASERSSSEMARAATRFLASLTPEQRQRGVFAFGFDELTKWHFVPSEMFPRNGLPIGEMTVSQRRLAHDLLKSGLSQRGYLTATAIMSLDAVLKAIEAEGYPIEGVPEGINIVRDPERYYFAVFGTPSTRDTWGWRVEGHHVSLHFTLVNGTMTASTPTFFGSNPAEVPRGPRKGLRVLGAEEDVARALLHALDPAQRAKAIITDVAPHDIVTTNAITIDPLSPVGVTAAEMTPSQRNVLMRVIDVYASMMASDIAADRMARLRKAGIEKIGFAWAGEIERGKKHYYRLQGPTFLVEYDNTQNDGNHIHSVWRDFDGDFGRDLLREHLATTRHP